MVARAKRRSLEAQKGASSAYAAIIIIAVVVELITVMIAYNLYHKESEDWATKWSNMKSARDFLKGNCEQNSQKIQSVKIWSEQGGVKPPADYLVASSCVFVEKEEK